MCNLIKYYHEILVKSSAGDCGLSPFGQQETGHLMKTKSTSDTLVLERCCKSTIPFVSDDTDGIGEILIDLCNGRQIGNMKVGVRKPRTIPLICSMHDSQSLKATTYSTLQCVNYSHSSKYYSHYCESGLDMNTNTGIPHYSISPLFDSKDGYKQHVENEHINLKGEKFIPLEYMHATFKVYIIILYCT